MPDKINRMDKFFSVFGKIVLVAAIAGSIAYAAYSYGKTTSGAPSTVAAVPTEAVPTTDVGLKPETKPVMSPAVTSQPAKILTAGLDSSSGLSFTKYQMNIIAGWTADHATTHDGTWTDTVTVTKGGAKLKIFQAATGGAVCLYTGDADFEGPSSRYDTYVDLKTADAVTLRRGSTNTPTGGVQAYTVCQKGSDNFGQPTVFGHISFTAPVNGDAALLSDVDAMLVSLKKQ